jgi:hypothetical protein
MNFGKHTILNRVSLEAPNSLILAVYPPHQLLFDLVQDETEDSVGLRHPNDFIIIGLRKVKGDVFDNLSLKDQLFDHLVFQVRICVSKDQKVLFVTFIKGHIQVISCLRLKNLLDTLWDVFEEG